MTRKKRTREEYIKSRLMEGPLRGRVNSKGNLRGTHPNNKKASKKNIRKAQFSKVKKTLRMRDALSQQLETCRVDHLQDCDQIEMDILDLDRTVAKWKSTFKKAKSNHELTSELEKEMRALGLV